jgi:hypothetical protein
VFILELERCSRSGVSKALSGFSASGILPSLLSGQVSVDESEHFLHNRSASVATLRGPPDRARRGIYRFHTQPGIAGRATGDPVTNAFSKRLENHAASLAIHCIRTTTVD